MGFPSIAMFVCLPWGPLFASGLSIVVTCSELFWTIMHSFAVLYRLVWTMTDYCGLYVIVTFLFFEL